MINAVCFNLHVFRRNILQKIIRQTGGYMLPVTGDGTHANCIQSTADGTLHYAFCWPQEIERTRMYDCGGDIEKFIRVNARYGRGTGHD